MDLLSLVTVVTHSVQLVNVMRQGNAPTGGPTALQTLRRRRQKNPDELRCIRERLRCRRVILNRLLSRLQNPGARRLWVQPELLNNRSTSSCWETNVPHYTDERFIKKFRVSRVTFQILVDTVRPYLERKDTKFRECVKIEKRVACALYCLKSNCDFWSIADWFRIGKSTVPELLYEFCDVVNNVLLPEHVKYSKSLSDKEAAAEDFYNYWQFPNCFGALDGTHIPILEPPKDAEDYWNYKHYHSLVLLGMVDAHYKFNYVNVGSPGRVNDAAIFNRSSLRAELLDTQRNDKYHIIGDGAFPLMLTLLKPYTITHNMPTVKENFNRRLSRARVVIEDAFGRLKGRWRILMKRADLDVENMKAIIRTCVVLHNLCETHREPYLDSWKEVVDEFNIRLPQPNINLNERAIHHAAVVKRDNLAILLMNDDIVIHTT